MNRIKDCREKEAISLCFNNCTDIGILNAISRHEITRFADLTSIVRKYYATESVRKTEDKFWDNPAPNTTPVQNRRAYYRHASKPNIKKQKPSIGYRTVMEGWLNGPCKIHNFGEATPTHSLRACWILRQVARCGDELLTPAPEEYLPNTVSTVFETFTSNNARKRTLRNLAAVYQVATINPWSDMTITFNASDEQQPEHQPHWSLVQ